MNNVKKRTKVDKKRSKKEIINLFKGIEDLEVDSEELHEKKDTRTEKRKKGDLGEELACKYLINKNFSIIERNYLKKYGEIDIIAQKGDIYHFFEVKTVTHVTSGLDGKAKTGDFKPEDNVQSRKLKRLSRVIEAYILDKKLYSKDWEVSVITVTLNMETRLANINIFNNIL